MFLEGNYLKFDLLGDRKAMSHGVTIPIVGSAESLVGRVRI